MSKIELIPFITDRRSYRVCIDGAWFASIHTHPLSGSSTAATMLWADIDCPPDEAVGEFKGGMPEAYQWVMRTLRKYPAWIGPQP